MATHTRMTVSTATGRRRQLFSPVLLKNGRAKRIRMTIGGTTSNPKVSMYSGMSAATAKIHMNQTSGRGRVSISAG